MTTVTVYRSSDASAPSLTGQAGGLITVLDACLVNGYGSQANAGWTKSFSGTNKAAYRNSAVDGTGFYLHIDDTGTGQFPTSAQLNLFTGSVTGGVVCRKSTTADSTARNWTIVADDTVFYLFAETGDYTNPVAALCFMFGDIFSYKSSDAYRCMIMGRLGANQSGAQYEPLTAMLSVAGGTGGAISTLSLTISGHFMDRSWTGVGGSLAVGKHIDTFKIGGGAGAAGSTGTSGSTTNTNTAAYSIGRVFNPAFFPYPNGPDGGLYLSPVWVHHSNAVRGYLKGLWAPLHDRPLNHNDTYSGTGNLNSKSFLVQALSAYINSTNDYGQVHVETSSTWS